jgi:hypothetical protein
METVNARTAFPPWPNTDDSNRMHVAEGRYAEEVLPWSRNVVDRWWGEVA